MLAHTQECGSRNTVLGFFTIKVEKLAPHVLGNFVQTYQCADHASHDAGIGVGITSLLDGLAHRVMVEVSWTLTVLAEHSQEVEG